MRRLVYLSITTLFCFNTIITTSLIATEETNTSTPTPSVQAAPSKPFVAFTGKITKNKVRLRIQPNLDGQVVKELSKDDLIVVLGENEDFYAVQPPIETKAYIFRTFVLDNVVEGNRVNVRLEPNTEAPVVAQVNQGDRIQGIVSPINSKWLEIAPPSSSRFYIAKEFVMKIGDPTLMATIAKRREEVNRILSTAYSKGQEEMDKPFEDIQIENVLGMYQKVINQYPDFNDQVGRAKDLLSNIQDAYLKKKVTYLENRTQQLTQQQKETAARAAMLVATTQKAAQQAVQQAAPASSYVQPATASNDNAPVIRQSNWAPIEQTIYQSWISQNGNVSMEDYYEQQKDSAIILKGIVEANTSSVKNRPGDFILINPSTQLPIAYLYSTEVDLQNKIGQNVTLQASGRPNHHFAFPAYFVFGVN